MTEQDISYEREKSRREDLLEGKTPRMFSDAYLAFIAVQRRIAEALLQQDTLLFHGSVVAVDGVAYLFTAKSGTGKSTHTHLWRELFGPRAVMVNDDKPFLQITKEGVLAYGSPWDGKHGLSTNICVPLKAICILERGTENRIAPVSMGEVLTMLFQQSQRPRNPAFMGKYMELIDGLAKKCTFYRLACTMDPNAARVAYEAMSGHKFDDIV